MSAMFKKNYCQSCYHSNYYFGLIFGIAYNNLQQQVEIYSQNNACTILVIIFWRSTMFYYRSDLPQVKENLTSNLTNLVYGLPQGLLKFVAGIAQRPVFLLLEMAIQKYTNQISKFSILFKFYWISLRCSKCFLPDCLRKQVFGHNSIQYPPNFIFFTYSETFVKSSIKL